MAENKTIQLKRSSALNAEGNGPKLPTVEQLKHGEIAINFAKGYETISLKNNGNGGNGEIVPLKFHGGGYVLTENDVRKDLPETKEELDRDIAKYNNFPVSAYTVCGNFLLYDKKIFEIDSKKIPSLSNNIDINKKEIFGDGTAEKPGLIKDIASLTGQFKVLENVYNQDIKSIQNRLTALETQLKGVEEQTTKISTTANGIITNAQ